MNNLVSLRQIFLPWQTSYSYSWGWPSFHGKPPTTTTRKAPASVMFALGSGSGMGKRRRVPARDRVIDFGKHKGKMLGTLPSEYLRWVSKKLRAGELLEWAELADEVLEDQVYRDRIEWEQIQKLMTGEAEMRMKMRLKGGEGQGEGGVAAELERLIKSFGWDYDDAVGWHKVDYGLLGTSKGGRIPRVGDREEEEEEKMKIKKKLKKVEVEEEEEDGDGDRGRGRERRRERVRSKREQQRRVISSSSISSGRTVVVGLNDDDDDGGGGGDRNRFPGRESLLRKVQINRGKLKPN